MASAPDPEINTCEAVLFLGGYGEVGWILDGLGMYLVEEPAAFVAVTAATMNRELSESLS
jgi:hypothetical protein